MLALVLGQVMFKKVSGQLNDLTSLPSVNAVTTFGVAVFLYAVSTVLWIFALRSLELSKAYMFMSAGFIIIPIISHFYFNEPLGIKNIIGSSLIVAGIWISIK